MVLKDLKPGDQVVLLSGGPIMTVSEIRNHTTASTGPFGVHCQWFAGKKLERGVFAPQSLKKTEGEEQKKN